MAKVLVTGGTGFIGSHLVERLLEQGRDVRVLALKTPIEKIEASNEKLLKEAGAEIVYGDLLDVRSLKKALKNVDTVFHLAAISRPMDVTDEQYYNTNVQGTRNLLELVKDKKIKRFIHTSTVSVLGVSRNGKALKEDDFQYDDLEYGLSKREGEHVALDYFYKYKVPVVVIRPSLVYGPRCLVRSIMFKYVRKGIFPLFNDGKAKMEFAYVDNVVQALLLAEKKPVLGEVFNITDGKSYPIGRILKIIAEESGVRPPFISMPTQLGVYLGIAAEMFSKIVGIYPPFSRTAAEWMSKNVNVYDSSKAKKVLGYKPEVSLREGIKRSIAWYEENGVL